MPIKNSPITMQYLAWDTVNNVGKVGDAPNHIMRAVGDGTEYTPGGASATVPVEVDATNLKGVYKIAIAASENNYDVVTLGGRSTTPNISIMPITWMNTVSAVATAIPATAPAGFINAAAIAANALDGKGDWLLANGYTEPATAAAIALAVLATQMTEGYNADGVAPTLEQALFVVMQRLTDFIISGVDVTVHKLDGQTAAYGLTLDSAVDPILSTSRTS